MRVAGLSGKGGFTAMTVAVQEPRWPRLAPDYIGVVVPPNLAPLNFVVQEAGLEYAVSIKGSHGQPLEIRQADPNVQLPVSRCKELLSANRGAALLWNVAVRNSADEWIRYAAFTTCLDNFNAPELARGPVQISEEELARAVTTPTSKRGASSLETPTPTPPPDAGKGMNDLH